MQHNWDEYRIPSLSLDQILTCYVRDAIDGERCDCFVPDGDECGNVAFKVLAIGEFLKCDPAVCNKFCRTHWAESEADDRREWREYRKLQRAQREDG